MKQKVCIINKVTRLNHRSFYKDGRSLAHAGYNVCLLGLYGINEVREGITIASFPIPRRRLTRFIVTNYRVFRRALREKADIYHFHDLDFVPWAVLLKLFTKAKVIYCIREAHPEYILLKSYLPQFMRRGISVLVRLMEQSAVRFYDAVLPSDNFIGQQFRHKNNVVIFHFPLLELFNGSQRIPWDQKEYDLFYHGSVPRYHFETMMGIAESLNAKGIHTRWGVAMNPGSPRVWAEEELKRRGLEKNFTLLSYLDHGGVGSYLDKARIGIIPLPPYKKFMKNLPVKLFEFMGFGIPVVLSDLPPSRQFVQGEECAIAVRPDDIGAYTAAIQELLSNPAKAVEMGERGRRLVFEKYNWTVSERRLLGVYEALLAT